MVLADRRLIKFGAREVMYEVQRIQINYRFPKNPGYASESVGLLLRKPTRVDPYIEPSFSKMEFPKEKPSILLVSAVGASGKTTAAHALSFDIQLPILDLAKHKAVGDNTLTGILTTAYSVDKIGAVLERSSQGNSRYHH